MRPVASEEVDIRSLERALRGSIEGEVRFSPGDRGLYSATGANYRQGPIGVVIPRSADDVVATIAAPRAGAGRAAPPPPPAASTARRSSRAAAAPGSRARRPTSRS